MVKICFEHDPRIKKGWNWVDPDSIKGIRSKMTWGLEDSMLGFLDLTEIDSTKPRIAINMNEFICFYMNDIPRLLDLDLFIKIYVILGAQTRVAVDINTVPEYLRDDESINDILDSIIENLNESFATNQDLSKILDDVGVKDITQLKEFPKKKIEKEELYRYKSVSQWSLNDILEKVYKDFDYWTNYDFYYKFKINEVEYLLHIYHLQSGGNVYKIYRYDNKGGDFMINETELFQILIYNLWKML